MISLNDLDYLYDCKGNACAGDTISFYKELWLSSKLCGTAKLYGKIIQEFYNDNGRHEFNIVLHNGVGITIRGRDLYNYELKRMPWIDEQERVRVLEEKHLRGAITRRKTHEKFNRKNASVRERGTGQFHFRRTG